MNSPPSEVPDPQLALRHSKVLIADNHPGILEQLVNLLKNRFEVVGAVTDGNVLIEAADRLGPQVVITDVSMTGLNGIDALRRLKAARPEIKVIISTMHVDAGLATEAIRSGASGFVAKLLAGVELVSAINQALEGGVYLTPAVSQEVILAIPEIGLPSPRATDPLATPC